MKNNTIKLGKVVRIQSGYSPSSFTLNDNGPIPYIKVEDMNNCNKYQNESRFYTDDIKRSVPAGAVIFPKRGAAIMNNKVRIAERDICMDTNMMALIPDQQYLDSEYLFNLLIHEKLYKIADTSTIPQINNKHIDPYLIPLPSISEQKEIVKFITQWDTAIEKTEALIDAKERQFGWLKSKLIGQQNAHTAKLGDHFGKSIIIEKGKPLIKANIAENGNIPVIAGGKSSPYSHDQLTHSVPCITISASGAYAGYVWYHDYPIWASDCNVIYSTEHSTEYLYFALKMKQSRIYAFQSGGGQPHVYARDLKNISIPLPPLEEQTRIAIALKTAQQEITLLKKLADQYRTQKRGLMQKLLSGEWRIKNKEAQSA